MCNDFIGSRLVLICADSHGNSLLLEHLQCGQDADIRPSLIFCMMRIDFLIALKRFLYEVRISSLFFGQAALNQFSRTIADKITIRI